MRAVAAQLEAIAEMMRSGQSDAATTACRHLLARQPTLGDTWYNLGYLLRQQGDFEGALAAYAQALTHAAGAPEQIHLNRAAIYSDQLQQYPQAQHELELALQRRPGYAPALLNLGNLNEDLGRRDHAAAAYRELLAATSSASPALRLQAQTRLLELESAPASAQAVVALQHAAADAALAPELRASALFAAARGHERRDDLQQALALADSANRMAHASAPPYDQAASAARFAAIAATFATPAPSRGEAPPGPAPLFICGMFRSGSTLLEQVLSRHPQIHAGGELDALPRLVAARLRPFPQSAAALSDADYAALAADYRARTDLPALPGGLRYLTDKRPDNVLLAGLAKRLFPHARIVVTTREPMDTGLSIFMHHLNPRAFPYAGRLPDIGHYQRQVQRLVAHWRRLYPDSIHLFDYDAFVASPAPTLQALLEFLALPWHAPCLQPEQAERAVRTASHWQVRAPLHANASGRWRRYGALLEPLRQALDAAVEPPAQR